MTEAITWCTRGCVRARRHATTCADTDCTGCQPRQAEHGALCWPCHRHLELMLTDAPHVAAWLHVHLPRGTTGKARNDAEQRQGTKAPPAPVDLDVIELTDRWAVSLYGWADNLADDQHLTHRPGTTVSESSAFLLRWLTTVEHATWVTDLYDELVDLTRDSHQHVPWAPEVRRVHGIPCPECHTCALVVYGGQADVTCQQCRLVIPEARYGIWTRMLADEHRAKADA
jgi:hypothetical protein